jgi:GntR family transcriptional repressor for pyruvate dehydrogenase complex
MSTQRSAALTDRVTQGLLDTILVDGLEAGHQLPSERELGEQYGVSRSVIREAVRSLAARGIVEVQMGRHPRVAETDPATASEALGLYLQGRRLDYELVHEVRLLLEVHVAALAAVRATDVDIEPIAAAHARMTEAHERGDIDAATREDLEFHRGIALASHNELHPLLLDSISGFLFAVYMENLEGGYGTRALAEHGRILSCITGHDADGAREAMATHLEGVARTMKGRQLEESSRLVAASGVTASAHLGRGEGR